MMRSFEGRPIEVIDLDDIAAGQRVLEFRDPEISVTDSIIAVFVPDGGAWSDAKVAVSPAAQDVPVRLMTWAIATAQEILARA